MLTSAIIVFLFGALVLWSMVKGMQHWNNLPEQQRRIQELNGIRFDDVYPSHLISAK